MPTTTTRRTPIRKKISEETAPFESSISSPALASKKVIAPSEFETLKSSIEETRHQYESLLSEIEKARKEWEREKEDHKRQMEEENTQLSVQKKREEETYQYETQLKRRKDEDDFETRKMKWETELAAQKEERVKEKKELEDLRKRAEGFESEKEKIIKDATASLEKDLTKQFAAETELSIQKHTSEVALLKLKIENLLTDNERQRKEIEVLKSQIIKATEQVKEIAIQVVEAGRPLINPAPKSSENTSS